jgi:hypothetical protein
MKQLSSWKPIRRGNKYCAPACGRGCTFKEYTLARSRAARLAKRLGSGWTTRVWENLGWHYCVIDRLGYLKIYPTHGRLRDLYTAFLGEGTGGRWVESAETPEGATAKVILKARGKLNEWKQIADNYL